MRDTARVLTRLQSFLAALALTCGSAHASPPENARRDLATSAVQVASELALASAEAIKEKVLNQSPTSIRRENYLRARWMDPGSGRFVRQDDWHGDMHRPLTLNKYLYAAGDPVNRIDPSGYQDLVQTSLAFNTQAILAMGARVVGAATGMFIGNRINNIVSSRAAARACAARFATGLRSFGSGDCSDVRMPIVFMSETKMPGIGEHVMKSMAQGSPAIVHRTFLLKLTNRLVATAKCRLGLGISVVNAGTSCDEYPFASTYEGGLGSTVAKVPWLSNLIQGGVLSGFYSACMVEPEVFPLNEFLVLPVANGPAGANFQCRYFGAR